MNLFATILTYLAPSANYRGESEENRSVIQKITYGRFEYPIISPESMRNALREILAGYGLPCNRTRLHDEEQLAVRFRDYPDPDVTLTTSSSATSSPRAAQIAGRSLEAVKKAGRDEPTSSSSATRSFG